MACASTAGSRFPSCGSRPSRRRALCIACKSGGSVAPLTRGRGVTIGGVALVVVAIDQLTKTWAEHALADGPIHLFWTVGLNLTYNSGASFGLGPGLTPFITALGVVLLILLVGMSRSTATTLGVVAMGIVIGGASGNLVDRLLPR